MSGTLTLGGGDEGLRLEEQERIAAHLPTAGDVRVAATLRLGTFSGHYAEVWLEKPRLLEFARELAGLVASRRGMAKLESMSPGELVLELRALETSGRIELKVQLGRRLWCRDSSREVRLEGSLELDPNQLPSILAGFEDLAGERV